MEMGSGIFTKNGEGRNMDFIEGAKDTYRSSQKLPDKGNSLSRIAANEIKYITQWTIDKIELKNTVKKNKSNKNQQMK